MDDIDIYADLPSIHLEENKSEDESESKNGNKRDENNADLEKQVNELKTKLEQLEGLNKKIKFNFSSLLKTAKAEISRKDRTINDLRSKLDTVTFRRNRRNQYNQQQVPPPPVAADSNLGYVNGQFHNINTNQFSYPPPPINTAHQQENHQYTDNHNYVHPPPLMNIEVAITEELYHETNNHIVPGIFPQGEEIKQGRSIAKRHQRTKVRNDSDEESDDSITKKATYKKTLYGERLRKKLHEEKERDKMQKKEENERRKAEEYEKKQKQEDEKKQEYLKLLHEKRIVQDDLKLKKESVDEVNNKENLSLVNNPTDNMDGKFSINKISDKSVENNNNSTKIEVLRTEKVDYLQTKEVLEVDRHQSINYNGFNITDSKNSNIHDDKHYDSTYKSYKNKERHNHCDKYDYNEMYTDSRKRYSRQDYQKSETEKYNRHRSSHRHKSRDEERSKSRHRHKEDKNHYTEDKHHRSPKKSKHSKKDIEDRKISKDLNKDKKHKDKNKTPKRKRRSNSEDELHKTKQRKTTTEYSTDHSTAKIKEVLHETERKKNKLNNTEKETSNTKSKDETRKINDIKEDMRIDKDTGSKENSQENGRKKIKYDNNSEKTIYNTKSKSETTSVNNIRENLKTFTSEINENVLNKEVRDPCTSHINVENNEEDLEEGEIPDSPVPKSKIIDYKIINDKENKNVIETEINVKTNIEKKSDIYKNKETRIKLNQRDIEDTPSTSTVSENRSVDLPVNKDNNSLKEAVNKDNKIIDLKKESEVILDSVELKKEDKLTSLRIELQNEHEQTSNDIELKKDEQIINVELNNIENEIDKDKELVPLFVQMNTEKLDFNIALTKIENNVLEKFQTNVEEIQVKSYNGDSDPSSVLIKDTIEQSKENKDNKNIIVKTIYTTEEENQKKLQTTEKEKITTHSEVQHSDDQKLEKTETEQFSENPNILNQQLMTPIVKAEIVPKDITLGSNSNKKSKTTKKRKIPENVIIFRRRRRPAVFADSPPVVIRTSPIVDKFK